MCDTNRSERGRFRQDGNPYRWYDRILRVADQAIVNLQRGLGRAGFRWPWGECPLTRLRRRMGWV